MINLIANDIRFLNLKKINLIVGKNGCGKSLALRQLDQSGVISDQNGQPSPAQLAKRYISPERGGSVVFESSMEQNMVVSPGWLSDTRRKNQATDFRKQSVALFRQLELTVLRKMEAERNPNNSFEQTVEDINLLLDGVKITRGGAAFKIKNKSMTSEIDPTHISSGESELISLAIEILNFESLIESNRESLLLIDEPDVHLHPDLQARFMAFLYRIAARSQMRIILSTHSTPVLSALSDKEDVSLCFMKAGDKKLVFDPITDVLKKLIPVFGAHPLTSVFNDNPVLIVEGSDEERIWQQCMRTAQGRIKLFPVECGGKGELPKYELEANNILNAVYDDAKGYSLRDGDGIADEMEDLGHIRRFRLKCRSSENLLLTNEVLSLVNFSWNNLVAGLEKWLTINSDHPYYSQVAEFIKSGPDRRNFDLKEIRNIIVSILPVSKPWEVLVGRCLGGLKITKSTDYSNEGSIFNFLGEKLCRYLIPEE